MTSLIVAAFSIMTFAPLPEDSKPDEVTTPYVLLVIFSIYSLFLIWDIPHALMYLYSVATTLSLIVYAVIGLTLYSAARGKYEKTIHTAGQIILVGVVLRLLLIDVWNLGVATRIATFTFVGVALVATAFLRKKSK